MSGTAGSLRTPPPTLGQDTIRVLEEIGFSAEEIARFRRDRVI
jgi:crotonobetainyl-CoA:carnitine CoA-transferase CaiB-like acyl-CoA transferase